MAIEVIYLKNIFLTKIIEKSSFNCKENSIITIGDFEKYIYEMFLKFKGETVFEPEYKICEFLNNKFSKEILNWEIGLNIKHNHDAVKHSRLSHKIDFGAEWFEKPCSQNYWQKNYSNF